MAPFLVITAFLVEKQPFGAIQILIIMKLMKSIEFKIFEIMKTILYPISLILLFITLLSCKTEQPKYIEIKEPENTKKIIETRCYEIAGEIDGDYIPGEEYIGVSFPAKDYYGTDDKILLSINDYRNGDYEQKHIMTVTNYKYDSKHQLDNITSVWGWNDVGWTGIVELRDTAANLTFKRNELGLVTEIEGFGTVITPDGESYDATKFIYNKDGKIVKEVHDSYYKTYQYFSLRNGHTVVKCDEYGEDLTFLIRDDFPVYQGKKRSLTEIYDNGQKVKSLEQEYRYGKLYSDNETTFMYDDKNRMIQIIKKRAEAVGMNVAYSETYEDFMNRRCPLMAMYNEIKEYKYDKKGNLIEYKEEYLKPKLDGGCLCIGDKLYSYTKESRNRGLNYKLKYYYNEYGDWYKCRYDCFEHRKIFIRNIEYRR